MSVVEALIGVIAMQLATTIMGVTPALATLDTQAMGFLAQVSEAIYTCDVLYSVLQFIMISLNNRGYHQNGHKNSSREAMFDVSLVVYVRSLCVPAVSQPFC